MKLKYIKIVVIASLVFLGILLGLNYLYDYPEMYRVKKVNLEFLRPVSQDSSTKCYHLVSGVNPQGTTLVKIRFEVEYVNKRINGLSRIGMYVPYGWQGHTDSISRLDLYLMKNGKRIEIDTNLRPATNYRFFTMDEILDGQSLIQAGCYEANIAESINSIIRDYNSNMLLAPEEFEDLYLFEINSSVITHSNLQATLETHEY